MTDADYIRTVANRMKAKDAYILKLEAVRDAATRPDGEYSHEQNMEYMQRILTALLAAKEPTK